MNRLIAAAVSAVCFGLCAAPPAHAQDPFIFVLPTNGDGTGDGSGLAWWLKGAVIRPMGSEVSGVSIARLNEHRGDMAFGRWCFASALSRQSFVSPDRLIQREIDVSMMDTSQANFAASGPFAGRDPLDAVVGNYQGCDGSIGAFLLLTDRSDSRNVVFLEEWENWRGLIWLQNTDNGLVVGSCFECGHAESLFYDARRNRFYWESTGD